MMRVGRIDATTLIVSAVALAVGYFFLRGVKGVVGDVVTVIDSATGAAIQKVATVVGVPETDVDKCAALIEAGEWWDASFYCPAGTFLKAASGTIFDPSTGEVIGQGEPGDDEIIMLN